MALDRDELNKRRQDRQAQRKKKEQARRMLLIRIAVACVVLIGCGVGIFLMTRNSGQPAGDLPALSTDSPQFVEVTEPPTEAPTEPTKSGSWQRPPVSIKLVAAGDLNITDKVVWSGQEGDTFDYTNAFIDVAPIFSEADLAVLNFEGNVCGTPYGTATVSAPPEMLTALKRAGIDMVQVANSCSISNGLIGMNSTLNNIHAAGIEPLGAYSSVQELKRSKGYTIVTVNDIKIAFVAFTKGVGSLGMPAGSEELVNLLYEDYYTTYRKINTEGITKILKAAQAEKPDFMVAMLHWGSEDNDTIYDTQESIVKLLQKNGVNAIIGTHPHRVLEVKYDDNNGNLVAYSLGDFFGDGTKSGTNYSIILDLTITKDYESGVTRITNWDFVPIYTLSETECDGKRRVIRIENAMAAYELNFVDKVTADCYNNLKFAIERINARVTGKN